MSHTPSTPSLHPSIPLSLLTFSLFIFFPLIHSLLSVLAPPAPIPPLPIISSSVLLALGLLHIASLVSPQISPFFAHDNRQEGSERCSQFQSLLLLSSLCFSP